MKDAGMPTQSVTKRIEKVSAEKVHASLRVKINTQKMPRHNVLFIVYEAPPPFKAREEGDRPRVPENSEQRPAQSTFTQERQLSVGSGRISVVDPC
jgi:hypothetical protein